MPGTVELGAILTALPGAALVALLAPRVSYRRRDGLTVIFFPLAGLRVAWIIGTRLAQLPYRTWPEREDGLPIHDRHYAWIALAGNRYNLWRERRAERAASRAATPSDWNRTDACYPIGTALAPADESGRVADNRAAFGNLR